MRNFKEALTFDDVLLVPAASDVLPNETNVQTRLTKNIKLGLPIISAAMDTVTESSLAIAMAQEGGIGIIHRNMSIEAQASEVRRVKKYESGMIVNPVTIGPDQPLSDALKLMKDYNISGIPVVETKNGKLVGIITNRDLRFAKETSSLVKDYMTAKNLITVKQDVAKDQAMKLLHENRIEKLLVVDDAFRCVGLITVKDIEKAQRYPHATKDDLGRLRVGAAVGTGEAAIERAKALIDAEIDVIIVDTAHGHSESVLETIRKIRKMAKKTAIIGGNIATAAAAKALIAAGVDGVKVGIGPGSICTTRIIAGVGVPQLTAVMDVAEVCNPKNIPVIADGGIRTSGDLAKAIAAGASTVMIGSLFAGTEESPGDVFLYEGRSYKSYRGMGSLGAMSKGSADRYFQGEVRDTAKFVPEGVEARVPYKGLLNATLHQLIGGLRASMGYTGSATIPLMQKNCEFVRITSSGFRESHVHDVTITKEAPNYKRD